MCYEPVKHDYPDSFYNPDIVESTRTILEVNRTSYFPSFVDEATDLSLCSIETVVILNNCMYIIEMFLYAFKVALIKKGMLNNNNNNNINFSVFHILQYYNITSFNDKTEDMRPSDFLSYFLDGAGPVITDEKEDINSINQENFTIKVSSNLTKPYHANTIICWIYGPMNIKYLVNKYGEVFTTFYIKEEDIDYEKKNCYTHGRRFSKVIRGVVIGWDDNYNKSDFKVVPSEDGAYYVKIFGIKNVTYLRISYKLDYAYGYSFGDIDNSLFIDDNSIKSYAYDNPSCGIADWKFFKRSYLAEENGIKMPMIEGNTKNVFNTTYINNEYVIAVKYFIREFIHYQLIFEQNNESTILYEGYSNQHGYYTYTLKEPIQLITNKFSLKLAIKANSMFYWLNMQEKNSDDIIEPNRSYINDYDSSVGPDYVYNDDSWKWTPNDDDYEVHFFYHDRKFGPGLIRAITRIDGIVK